MTKLENKIMENTKSSATMISKIQAKSMKTGADSNPSLSMPSVYNSTRPTR